MAQAFKRYWTSLTVKEILHKTMKSFITLFMNLLNQNSKKQNILILFGWEQSSTGPYPSHCCKTNATFMLVAYQCPPNLKGMVPLCQQPYIYEFVLGNTLKWIHIVDAELFVEHEQKIKKETEANP